MGERVEYEYMPATICESAEHETNFAEMDMDTMQHMVKASNPTEVHNVARGWSDVHTQLVGGSGGGVKGAFDAAVNEVLQHWHGDSADKFKEQANKISKKIYDGAQYADYTSKAMKSAATILEQLKPEIESMEKPSGGNSFVNWVEDGGSRDDGGLKRDLADPHKSTQDALDNNSGSLSAGKEQQLRMAVKMEQLGAAYVSQAKSMGTWKTGRVVDDSDNYPGPPGGDPPPAIAMPMPSGSSGTHKVGSPSIAGMGKGPGSSAGGIKAPKTPGISGGIGCPQPAKGSFTPGVNTGLDGFNPPGGGAGGVGGGAGGGLNGAGGGIGGGTGGGAGGSGALGGSSGMGPGGAAGGMIGGGAAGAGGAGAGAGARGGGRAGMPGMAGAAGAKGGGAKGAGTAGRGGALARQKGGVIGSGGGKAGSAGQGGSGLHRSRGGAQAGAGSGGRRPAGMPGAHGVHGSKGKDKKGQNGERPDYLVEDEETWASERNVAPKVVE
ncbi:hypothetical protein ACFCVY_32255 [Streptomyces sp. NPDC056411]|uniref:hypothetical protein n=1 Tax=Streptomyces sp. NPDC056411 TaxID=3345813 RepID=UPI0035DC96A6